MDPFSFSPWNLHPSSYFLSLNLFIYIHWGVNLKMPRVAGKLCVISICSLIFSLWFTQKYGTELTVKNRKRCFYDIVNKWNLILTFWRQLTIYLEKVDTLCIMLLILFEYFLRQPFHFLHFSNIFSVYLYLNILEEFQILPRDIILVLCLCWKCLKMLNIYVRMSL